MKPNLGNTDRVVRTIMALAIVVLYFTGVLPGIVGIILLLFAIIFVVTSFISFCPVYTLLGISTNKKKEDRQA